MARRMTNAELQAILKEFPDDLPIMLSIFGLNSSLDSMDLNIYRANEKSRKDARYIVIEGKSD